MPPVRVPVNRGEEKKIMCPGYLERKFNEMVEKSEYLPDDNPKKLKTS